MWTLNSPDEKITITVRQQDDGSLSYCAAKYGKHILEESMLGIRTDLGDFIKDLAFEREETASIREEYSIPAGKKEIYINHANELALLFKAHRSEFIVRLRAFDDGIAFRYEINHSDGSSLLVNREMTEFRISPVYGSMWLQDLVPSYEGPYNARSWDQSINGQPFGMPSLFFSKTDNMWLMLNEANVINTNGSYCSCHLTGNENGCMTIAFAPEEKGGPLKSPLPFRSPWRYAVIVETLDGLVNSTVNYNLNPPSVIDDISWIHPGRALWSWWQDMNGSQLYLESRDYVDMAAAYGFEGVTLDCGWDASWIKDICTYAHKKGIQIWIWTHMNRLDTLEKAEKLIPLWAGWGVDGLKIDFFENDSQHTMWQYHMMADLMIRHRMMINFHGCTKPMGEGRTWPNFMTAEGIMGLEHYQWSNRLPDAVHNCTVPFIRNVAGPMDYTPTAFSNVKNKNTTMGHQLALPVVFDSGITNYALALPFMEGWKGTDFLRRTKIHYKGVKVLSGYPGDHAAILRYTDTEWLIGVITAPGKKVTIPLDFLGRGEYEAEIYEDSANGEMLSVTCRKVRACDMLELSLLAAGGAGIYITEKLEPLSPGICTGYMSSRYTEYTEKDVRLTKGSERVEWDAETSGFMLNGEAEFDSSATETKNYTLRLIYAAGESWKIELDCGDFSTTAVLPASGAFRTFITHNLIIPVREGSSTIKMKRLSGKAPAIWKLKLIDNDPFPPLHYDVEESCLRNGGEIIQENGALAAVHLGCDAELVFDKVEIADAGKYVLRILYAAGDNRDISVQTNGEAPIHTFLNSTCNGEFPSWENAGEREVLVNLRKGKNQIRLFNDHGLISHITGIELILLPDED